MDSKKQADQADETGTDVVRWSCAWTIEKRVGDWTGEDIDAGRAPPPYERIQREGNLLMYGGASVLWETLIGNGTATAGQTTTFFSNAQAALGVGDATAAAVATQTNLQASTNKLRKAMDATYPVHTPGTVAGAATISFRSTFGSTDANFAWQEWGVFNSTTDGTGRMLNRRVESNGTKAGGTTWAMTVSLTLA
jgi:hypothetical protein